MFDDETRNTIRRWLKEQLIEMATIPYNPKQYFTGLGNDGENSLLVRLRGQIQDELGIESRHNTPAGMELRREIIGFVNKMVSAGIVIPTALHQTYTWNADIVPFSFTPDGQTRLTGIGASLLSPNLVTTRLRELQSTKFPQMPPSIAILADEAERCIETGCPKRR